MLEITMPGISMMPGITMRAILMQAMGTVAITTARITKKPTRPSIPI